MAFNLTQRESVAEYSKDHVERRRAALIQRFVGNVDSRWLRLAMAV